VRCPTSAIGSYPRERPDRAARQARIAGHRRSLCPVHDRSHARCPCARSGRFGSPTTSAISDGSAKSRSSFVPRPSSRARPAEPEPGRVRGRRDLHQGHRRRGRRAAVACPPAALTNSSAAAVTSRPSRHRSTGAAREGRPDRRVASGARRRRDPRLRPPGREFARTAAPALARGADPRADGRLIESPGPAPRPVGVAFKTDVAGRAQQRPLLGQSEAGSRSVTGPRVTPASASHA
jgi:hypothetical protein